MNIITLKPRHNERLRAGHTWIFSNELQHVPKELEAGSLVEVQDANARSYGTALFHPNSLISARLLGTSVDMLSVEFFVERIQAALHLRNRLFPSERSYRLVFGESDFLPGLVIDRYCSTDARVSADTKELTAAEGDYFVLQTLSAGMDARVELICEALRHVFPSTKAIIEKNNSVLRQHDGLELRESVLWGDVPAELPILENGISFSLSLLHGQKTGYFLDQKLNRLKIKELCGGMRVLDCFTNQGGFALHAAAGGARAVLGLDSSASAIERCRINTENNGMTDHVRFETSDVFDFLHAEAQKRDANFQLPPDERWDCIILDPPAFAKSRKTVPQALRGYAKMNRGALKLIPKGGLLATGSCSHHVSEDALWSVIQDEAVRERRQLRLIFRGMQSPCHPVLVNMPETQYLKFFIFEVL
jgi:23S rRNA (cytosine1962-C5)-methyltransferase